MRNDPPPPNLFLPQRPHKSDKRMKRASRLERAYPLIVLAFEEEIDIRLGRLLVLEGGAAQGVGRLRC